MTYARHCTAALVFLGLLGGCTQPPPNMYVMSAVPDAGRSTGLEPDPIVAIVRVQLPDYLNRSEIVSRQGSNGLSLADSDRWGEPLSDSLPRIYAQDLSRFIRGARVVTPEEGRGQRPHYEYRVNLTAYEPTSDGRAVMRGHWILRDLQKGEVVAEGTIDQTRPVAAGDYSAIVHALNENLNDSSRQIAAATERTVRP